MSVTNTVPKNDLSAAIAAAHQSSGKVIIAEQSQDREALRQALEECFHTQRTLIEGLKPLLPEDRANEM